MSLTKEFVLAAFDAYRVWDHGNNVLYKLCADHPDHTDDGVIIAKTWLIGRAYSAAVERRPDKSEFQGDAFYEKEVAPKFREAKVDLWLQELRDESENNRQVAIKVHKKMTDLLYNITGLNKRSFASKYLHFHAPRQFFIYDSQANGSVREIVTLDRRRKRLERVADIDREYEEFFTRCEQLSLKISSLIGRHPDPRELDKILLAWRREKSRQVGRDLLTVLS